MTQGPLAALAHAYVHREDEARARRARGQKVVGYFSTNVPQELILAAGAFPVQLTGSPDEETPLGDRYMEDFFDGQVRSLFDRVLRGHFDFVDLIVIPRTSEAMLQLYYFLQEAARWEPARKLPPLYLFDLLQTNNWLTGRYVRGRLDDFRQTLERVLGAAIADSAIAEAIAVTNRDRAAMAALDAWRHRDPPGISGTDMLEVIGASYFQGNPEHIRGVQAVLDGGLPALAKRPRLMIKGSPQDHAGFTRLVEDCGAWVVSEDHVLGQRNIMQQIRGEGDAMEALTEYYQLHSPSPRQFPQSRQDAIFLDMAAAAKVEGVIFHIEEFDDVLGWDYPAQKAALAQRGIPSLLLAKQSYRHPDRAGQKGAVTGFLASLAQAQS